MLFLLGAMLPGGGAEHWTEVSATSRWDPLGSRGLAEGKVWELQVEDSPLRKEAGPGSVIRGQKEQI